MSCALGTPTDDNDDALRILGMSFLEAYEQETAALLARAGSFRRLAVTSCCRILNLVTIEFGRLQARRQMPPTAGVESNAEVVVFRSLDLLTAGFSRLLQFRYAKAVPPAAIADVAGLAPALARQGLPLSAAAVVMFLKGHNALLKKDRYSASRAGVVNFSCVPCEVRFFDLHWCVINDVHDPDLAGIAAEGRLYSPGCPRCGQPATSTRSGLLSPPEPFNALFERGLLLYHHAALGDFSLTVMAPEEGLDHRFYAKVAAHFIEPYNRELPAHETERPGSFRIHVYFGEEQFSSELRRRRQDSSAGYDEEAFIGGLANSVVDDELSLEGARAAVRRSVAASPERFLSKFLAKADNDAVPQKQYVVACLLREVAIALHDKELMVESSLQLAGWANVVGETEEAIEALRFALSIAMAESHGDLRHSAAAAAIATRLSILYFEIGASAQALELARLALQFTDEGNETPDNVLEHLERLNLLGCILRDTDVLDSMRALRDADQKLIISEKDTKDPDIRATLRGLHAGILCNIALTHNHAAAALESRAQPSRQELADFRSLYPSLDTHTPRKKLADFARSEAERLLREAIEISRELGDARFLSNQLRNLANACNSKGQPEIALPLNQEAVALLGPRSLPTERADAVVDLAITELELARTKEAVDHAQGAIAEFEDHYFTQVGLGYRKRLGIILARAFDVLVQGKLDLGDDAGTLTAITRAKARTLSEKVDLQSIQPADPEEAGRYRSVISDLRRLESALWQGQPDLLRTDGSVALARASSFSSSRRDSLDDFGQLKALQAALSRYRRGLAKRDPRYAFFEGGQKADISERIGSAIGDATALLELYVSPTRTICALVHRGKVVLRQIARGRQDWLARLHDSWLGPASRQQDRETWEGCLASIGSCLGEWLWRDLGEVIEGLDVEHLVIAPHHALHSLPWHLMRTSRERMLCDEMRVSYAPSARTLLHLLSLPRHEPRDVAAVSYQGGSSDDIPFSRLEVDRLAETPGFKVRRLASSELRSAQATEFLEGADLLHFSCHGVFGGDDVLGSWLKLSGSDRLGFDEIAGRLKVKPGATAVLSACETALVLVDAAEEYLGLPYAFLCAGCRSVVSSLWKVPDMSTALLMIRFYDALAKGASKIESLRTAQAWVRAATNEDVASSLAGHELPAVSSGRGWSRDLHLLRMAAEEQPAERPFENPLYWAGFILLGDWR
jgi:CHAT domain-containing protein/tetratricopeptide (TPR) repeat protein